LAGVQSYRVRVRCHGLTLPGHSPFTLVPYYLLRPPHTVVLGKRPVMVHMKGLETECS
jgi:hypothetical protein